jgi:hypothetical protein
MAAGRMGVELQHGGPFFFSFACKIHLPMLDYPEDAVLMCPGFAFKMRSEERKPWQK